VLRSFFFYLILYPWTLLAAVLALSIAFFSQRKTHAFIHFWGRSCLWLGGVNVEVQGRENIPSEKAAIYVSNHQSNADIPAIYASLPIPFSWLAKQELFRVPLFGLAMKRAGCIPIDRTNRRAMMRTINAAGQQITSGTSVIIFPEGTRSPDGELQPFKKGALLIAAKAQVPVVPIAIRGSYQILPKHRWRMTPGSITVNILPPLPTENLKSSDIEILTTEVRNRIAASLQGATT